MQLMGVSIVDGWGHLHNKASCKLACTWLPREAKGIGLREREGERSPAKTSHLSVQAHSYPVSLAFPSSLACLVYWSSVGLCVKTAQQKNPRVATVEAGSLQSSPDERLQLTVAQWDTAAGAAGTVGQIDKVTSEISGWHIRYLRICGIKSCQPVCRMPHFSSHYCGKNTKERGER